MSRSACLTARGQSSLPGAYRHTGGQVTDEVVGRGLHGVVGHRVEDVHDVQRQHVGAVGDGVKRLLSRGAHEAGRSEIPVQVLSPERQLALHQDRVVDVGEPVDSRQPAGRASGQGLEAVAGALRLRPKGTEELSLEVSLDAGTRPSTGQPRLTVSCSTG